MNFLMSTLNQPYSPEGNTNPTTAESPNKNANTLAGI